MKLNIVEPTISTIPKTGSEYNVSATSKVFELLATKVYNNKEAAVVRELCANAYDSHVEAGKTDIPFKVIIPNELSPYLQVQDFGVGMDDSDIDKIYRNLGVSTKDQSDDYIGALGLGSKSPHAYSEIFYITAIKNGIKREYVSQMISGSMPRIDLILQSETEDNNGVTIKVPVKKMDFFTFGLEVSWFCSFYETRPIIYNHYFSLSESESEKLRENGYVMLDNSHMPYHVSHDYIVMGNVPYKAKIREHLSALPYSTTNNKILLVKCDMNEISFSTSREHTLNDKKTEEKIYEISQKTDKKIINNINDEISGEINSFRKVFYLDEKYKLHTKEILKFFPEYKSVINKLVYRNRNFCGLDYYTVRNERYYNSFYKNIKNPVILVKDTRYKFIKKYISSEINKSVFTIDAHKLTEHKKKRLKQYFGVEPVYLSWNEIRNKHHDPIKKRSTRIKTFVEKDELKCYNIVVDIEKNTQSFKLDCQGRINLENFGDDTMYIELPHVNGKYMINNLQYIRYGIENIFNLNSLKFLNDYFFDGKYKKFLIIVKMNTKKYSNLFKNIKFFNFEELTKTKKNQNKMKDLILFYNIETTRENILLFEDSDLKEFPNIRKYRKHVSQFDINICKNRDLNKIFKNLIDHNLKDLNNEESNFHRKYPMIFYHFVNHNNHAKLYIKAVRKSRRTEL